MLWMRGFLDLDFALLVLVEGKCTCAFSLVTAQIGLVGVVWGSFQGGFQRVGGVLRPDVVTVAS